MAIEIDEKDMLGLENDPEIEFVDLNLERSVFPSVQNADPNDNEGIAPGPFANDITVCGVDTGYGKMIMGEVKYQNSCVA